MNGVKWSKVTEKCEKIIIVCSGRSLTNFNFNVLKGLGKIICVNNSFKNVPFLDYWFTLDPWGLDKGQCPKSGRLFAAVPQDFGTPHAKSPQHRIKAPSNITFLYRLNSHNNPAVSSETAYRLGLSEDSGCISGGNSGYGALNLAYHMEPKKILILGMDGDVGYYYSKTEKNRPLSHLPEMMASSVEQLSRKNINVINGSINSVIDCFPRYDTDTAIREFKK